MDRRHRGITIRGNSAQIAITYQGVRYRETIPIPPTKAALKELVLKLHAIKYEIKTGDFDFLGSSPVLCMHFCLFSALHYLRQSHKYWADVDSEE